jgi:hypothetical protein
MVREWSSLWQLLHFLFTERAGKLRNAISNNTIMVTWRNYPLL